MCISNLKWVAGRVLNEDGQSEVEELLHKGKIERAKDYLLSAIQGYRERGAITFTEEAEFCNLLDFSPERILRLPQRKQV